MKNSKFSSLFLSACAFTILYAAAANAADIGEDGKYGKISGDFRYRSEFVDQTGLPDSARAHTARLRLGYESPVYKGFKFFGEMESNQILGGEQFNEGLNGKARYPRVNDPRMTGVNQAYLDYNDHGVQLRLGRQPLFFDNQRFVSWSKWRQNDVTHDAAQIQFEPLEKLKLSYAHSTGVNRYSGRRSDAGRYDANINLFNARYELPKGFTVSGYRYLVDFDEPTEYALSSSTYGVRAVYEPKGKTWLPFGSAEYARQSDYGQNPLSYDTNYYAVEAGAKLDTIRVSVAHEHLGSDGTASLQTPIGTAYNFLGWTEKFGTIPVQGLTDTRFQAVYPVDLPWEGQKITFTGQYHDFNSVKGSLDYGTELGLSMTYTPVKNHDFTLRYADYNAQDLFTDTTKVAVFYEYKF